MPTFSSTDQNSAPLVLSSYRHKHTLRKLICLSLKSMATWRATVPENKSQQQQIVERLTINQNQMTRVSVIVAALVILIHSAVIDALKIIQTLPYSNEQSSSLQAFLDGAPTRVAESDHGILVLRLVFQSPWRLLSRLECPLTGQSSCLQEHSILADLRMPRRLWQLWQHPLC